MSQEINSTQYLLETEKWKALRNSKMKVNEVLFYAVWCKGSRLRDTIDVFVCINVFLQVFIFIITSKRSVIIFNSH